jgi:glycine oxidase
MSTRTPRPDVVIVGAGVIGCSTAYFLAAHHGLRCLIVERNAVGSEASGGAAGELASVQLAHVGEHRPPALHTRFLREGINLHLQLAPTLQEESGINYRLGPIPILRPAFEESEARHMRSQIAEQASLGVDAEWLDENTVRGMDTWLAPDALGAAYSVEQQLEAYPFAIAMAQATEHHGVEIRAGEVIGIRRSGSRATGVRLAEGTIEADTVVVANGPWSQHAGAWMDFEVPVIPLRGQIVHLGCPDGVAPPRHAIFHESGYVLPKAGGDLLAGTTQEDVGFDRQPTIEARDAILEAVARIAPAIVDAPIRGHTACLRPYSLDDMPIIGAIPGWDSLYLATGHAFKGVTLCLITGLNLAQLIVNRTSDFPLDEFSPARLGARR